MTNPFRNSDQDTAIRDLVARTNAQLDELALAIPAIVRMDDEFAIRLVRNALGAQFTSYMAYSNLERNIADIDAYAGSMDVGGAYTAQAVHFDGATALSIASLSAGADTPFFLASLWFNMSAGEFDGNSFWVVDPEGAYMSLDPTSTFSPSPYGIDLFFLADASGTNLVSTNSGDPMLVTPGDWHNVLVTGQTNLPEGEKIHQLYVDDVPYVGSLSDVGNFLMTFTGKSFHVCDNGSGSSFRSGNFADIWIAPGQFVDLSIEANRRKFIDVDGKPADLGSDGSTPTGTAPAIFFTRDGAASTFAVNQGTGGAFTLTGTLTSASTSPSG